MGGGVDVPWVERLDITAKEAGNVENFNDDIEREAAFYKQAYNAVDEAFAKLDELKILYRRPEDYFAEMVKTDEQMRRIRGQLLREQEELNEEMEKRKQRTLKKFGKQIQHQKLNERQQQKKKELDIIKKWRKERKHGKNDDEEFPIALLKGGGKNETKPQPNKKRQYKNARFGYGGKKRRIKSNDKDSVDNVGGFNPYVNKKLFSGVKGPGSSSKRHQRKRNSKRKRAQ
eukprot:TRINITY_DN2305_c0_g1_i1.p1 TRINITY_DN2305_c0_g1~~TRINITY_DN2305_c0_g1_i1.p1  ORF type:complete len:268 (-),score=57.51 TRINITY_DN2305_c0_g1_i1:76-765(-)